jgi:DNA-binding transcriptional regulator YiaG
MQPQYTPSARDLQRFWSKVDKSGGVDACWLWIAAKDKRGYGEIRWNNHMAIASRVAWELTNGSIPDCLCVCHHCDNPSCVNPSHLFLGTQKDNLSDCQKKGRRNWVRGEKHPSCKLSDKQVAEIRQLYATGEISQPALAQRFGVGIRQVWGILHYENRVPSSAQRRKRSPKGKYALYKLSDAQVAEIRQRYAKENITQTVLAVEFGVSQSQIGRIVRYKRRKS